MLGVKLTAWTPASDTGVRNERVKDVRDVFKVFGLSKQADSSACHLHGSHCVTWLAHLTLKPQITYMLPYANLPGSIIMQYNHVHVLRDEGPQKSHADTESQM